MKIIKRYGNRKLYSTDDKRYVTLARVAEMVRVGEDVQVVCHVTGADLTAQILAQVIYEEVRWASGVRAEVLARVIREGISAQQV
jgi:polyhydroxyalkanoate synthesis repressor PhaR